GVMTMTPVISMMARRARGSRMSNPRTTAYRHTTMQIEATAAFTHGTRTMNVARYRQGIVTMSPDAVTMGVDTESRSYPRRTERSDRPMVRAIAIAEPSTPPTTEMGTNSRNETARSPDAATDAR